ncbi:MAG: cysteine--tRNA ligase [Desulfobacterales bacterium]|nr:cysteine--tRNA ligase [Deltaproteobacteria bacterium]NNL42886.1 cysteine--tRNA ligase [Desulfobacterales bacterium]
MTIQIYNTLSRKKETFEPGEKGRVKMYVCGPTVYDSCHIGHARSVVVFDVIARYLRSQGYEVTYVRNFTDVDDKIINKAKELGIDSKKVAERYINEFYSDMDALNVQRATFEPRATEHINDIIDIAKKLISKDFAYQVNGDVYFAVELYPDYGKLSGRKLEEMEAGARVDVDQRKRNPFDFAIWKSAKPGEPSWDSPWGKGRPGWHIECSAMIYALLGESIDIHGGGRDLTFPHHENEIAQSEAAFGKQFIKYWVHNGFVNIDQEKMSKSLGNFLMIKDVLKSFHPEAIRLFLLSNHYRSPIDFTDQAMDESSTGLDKIYKLLERTKMWTETTSAKEAESRGSVWNHFCGAMDDDFNTARGIGVLFGAVRKINRLLDNTDKLSVEVEKTLRSDRADIIKIGSILGMLSESPQTYFDNKKAFIISKKSIDPVEIDQLVQERFKARKSKDWKKADLIRKQLEDMNIKLEDGPEGTVWTVK